MLFLCSERFFRSGFSGGRSDKMKLPGEKGVYGGLERNIFLKISRTEEKNERPELLPGVVRREVRKQDRESCREGGVSSAEIRAE